MELLKNQSEVSRAKSKLESFIDKVMSEKKFSQVKLGLSDSRKILRESGLPFLPIQNIKIPHREMLEEAKNLKSIMVPHRSYKEENRGWRSICIHGISSAHSQCASQYGMEVEDPSIYRWTDVSDFAPVTVKFFKENFHYDVYHRVRFMLLEPGGWILPHRDFDHYVLGPVNIALNNPDGCHFYMEDGGIVPFESGSIMKLALINHHAVYNSSDEDRFHIIVHGAPNWKFWSPIFQESYLELLNHESIKR